MTAVVERALLELSTRGGFGVGVCVRGRGMRGGNATARLWAGLRAKYGSGWAAGRRRRRQARAPRLGAGGRATRRSVRDARTLCHFVARTEADDPKDKEDEAAEQQHVANPRQHPGHTKRGPPGVSKGWQGGQRRTNSVAHVNAKQQRVSRRPAEGGSNAHGQPAPPDSRHPLPRRFARSSV